jgi:ribosomal protein L16 Arg81 hydroxylase
MNFKKLIYPMGLEEFLLKYNNNESFIIKGHKDKFSNLITLEEIESTINNGCNINSPMQIIKDGVRHYYIQQNLKWSQVALQKSVIKKLLEEKHSFMMMNQTQINKKVSELIDTIESTFTNSHADLHLYISPKTASTGYDAHRDRPQHKIYMQIIGMTHWKIYKIIKEMLEETIALEEKDEKVYLEEEKNFTLEPGDLLYMPSGTFHKVRNEEGPRVSFSIPFVIEKEKSEYMDRTYIHFKELFDTSRE